jgi:hypothetical protein
MENFKYKMIVNKYFLSFSLSLFIAQYGCAQKHDIQESGLLGFWISETTIGPEQINLVLYFYSEDGQIKGKSFFTNNERVTDEGIITNIRFTGRNINFILPSQGTQFDSKTNPFRMDGKFLTPGNPEMKFSFSKTDKDKLKAIRNIENALSPYNPYKKFSTDNLIEDFDILIDAIKSHPEFYQNHPMSGNNFYYDSLKNRLTDEMTAIEFLRLVTPVIADLHCYHSSIVLPDKIQKSIFGMKSIPLDVIYVNNKLFVKNCYDKIVNLKPGSEIIEINNRPSQDIIKRLSSIISSDRNNQSHKRKEINENFWFFYLYLENPVEYTLKVRSAEGNETEEVQLNAISRSDIKEIFMVENASCNPENESDFPLNIQFSNRTGILTIRSFFYPDQEKYKKTIHEYFNQLTDKNINALIVDLRNNRGGYPELAAYVLSYFITEPIVYLSQPENDPQWPIFLKPINPQENVSKFQSYFLSDGNSLSSSGHLLSLIKYHHLGVIVGDIPGGSFSCNDETKLWTLPNSQIQVAVAQTTISSAVKGMIDGEDIIPDYLVNPTLNAMLQNRDEIMDFVLSLIQSENEN